VVRAGISNKIPSFRNSVTDVASMVNVRLWGASRRAFGGIYTNEAQF
jgi:hypothetical protein